MRTIKLKTLLLMTLLSWHSLALSRSMPLTWDVLIENSDAVITGKVIEAKLNTLESKASSTGLPITIKVKVSTHDLTKDDKVEPPSEVLIHYRSFHNPVSVGLEGTFFIRMQNNRYLISDSEYGSWPITYIRTSAADTKSQNPYQSEMTAIYDMNHIHIYQLPDELQETVIELKFELDEGQVKQSTQAANHITPKTLKKFLSSMAQ